MLQKPHGSECSGLLTPKGSGDKSQVQTTFLVRLKLKMPWPTQGTILPLIGLKLEKLEQKYFHRGLLQMI